MVLVPGEVLPGGVVLPLLGNGHRQLAGGVHLAGEQVGHSRRALVPGDAQEQQCLHLGMGLHPREVHQAVGVQHHSHLFKVGAQGLQQRLLLWGEGEVVLQMAVALLAAGAPAQHPQGGVGLGGGLLQQLLGDGVFLGVGIVLAKELVHQAAVDSLFQLGQLHGRGLGGLLLLHPLLVEVRQGRDSLQPRLTAGLHKAGVAPAVGSPRAVAGEHRVPLGPAEKGHLLARGQGQHTLVF